MSEQLRSKYWRDRCATTENENLELQLELLRTRDQVRSLGGTPTAISLAVAPIDWNLESNYSDPAGPKRSSKPLGSSNEAKAANARLVAVISAAKEYLSRGASPTTTAYLANILTLAGCDDWLPDAQASETRWRRRR